MRIEGVNHGQPARPRASALLVDDDPLVLALLADVAEAAGLQPIPCRSLAAARDALEEHVVAVAIVDDDLPDGRGMELVHLLRRAPGERPVRIAFCTSAEASRRGEMAHVAPVIRKPFSVTEVERVLREAAAR